MYTFLDSPVERIRHGRRRRWPNLSIPANKLLRCSLTRVEQIPSTRATTPVKVRFATQANHGAIPGWEGRITPDRVVATARAQEADGFDVVCLADFGRSELFPALTLIARETSRVEVSSRIIGVFGHSPTLLASGAAWVDAVSGGRFSLGLGASMPYMVEDVMGLRFERPAARMEDTLKLYRALFGEDVPGVERDPSGRRRYNGATIRVRNATLDLIPLRTPPIYVAAVGPMMLRVAGAWADGVILEHASPTYVRWAWDRVQEGADRRGRSLDGFELCVETHFLTDTDDPFLGARKRSWLANIVLHCAHPGFDSLWRHGELWDEAMEVRSLVAAGSEREANDLARTAIAPAFTLTGSPDADRFRAWFARYLDLGVTMFAVSERMEDLVGVGPQEAKRWADLRRRDPETP